ncbi:hypothetical protein N7533_000980 [Penicillium manginii]|uniref:uncharacterized protein n=1 Tax=Penicillium manginii TaxID=203109 RepID=UPI0025491FC9|nr:uncharacterized protein N7533_000980 [Penicillium manginii]KAJ5768397.1 hypothetical protein N7533_000980 [Penicillium manginii]
MASRRRDMANATPVPTLIYQVNYAGHFRTDDGIFLSSSDNLRIKRRGLFNGEGGGTANIQYHQQMIMGGSLSKQNQSELLYDIDRILDCAQSIAIAGGTNPVTKWFK